MDSHNYIIQQLLKSLDFIESHICDSCRIADLADAAGYSLFHFCRIFNKYIHFSPYDYLVRRRLSCSVNDLLITGISVLDIAVKYCFETNEGYSRAFRKMFGVLPSIVRTGTYPDERLILHLLTKENIECRLKAGYYPAEKKNLKTAVLCGYGKRITPADLDTQIPGYLEKADKFSITYPGGSEDLFVLADEGSSTHQNLPELRFNAGEYIVFSNIRLENIQDFLSYFYSVFLTKTAYSALPGQILFFRENENWNAYVDASIFHY